MYVVNTNWNKKEMEWCSVISSEHIIRFGIGRNFDDATKYIVKCFLTNNFDTILCKLSLMGINDKFNSVITKEYLLKEFISVYERAKAECSNTSIVKFVSVVTDEYIGFDYMLID